MHYASIVRRLAAQPFACEPSFLAAMRAMLIRKSLGASLAGGDLHDATGLPLKAATLAATQQHREQARSGGIAVIPILGAIDQRPQSMGTSVEEIDGMLTHALNAKSVDAILFDIDSPGGAVSGVPELAERIAQAGSVKPTLALANSMAASAGYWLGSAANEMWVTPSGETGSIGIWTMHEDLTEHLKAEGIAVTEIAAGEFKTEGAPWKPLTEEAKAHLQANVDHFYSWFVRDVARFRSTSQTAVREGYGRGRVLSANDSLKEKLVDRIGTFGEAVGRLAKKSERRGPRSETLRALAELDTMERAS